MLAAVIPTIDESETIGDLVRCLDKMCDQVVVVDASPTSPATRYAAVAAGAICIDEIGHMHISSYGDRHMIVDSPRGLGPAYRIGWGQALPEWHVLHIDAGGSHDPKDVYPMIELAEEGFDVVIGSRFCPGGEHHGPWRRRFTSRMASAALNFISLAEIADWTSGFRLYSPRARAVLAAHTFTTTGHAWQIESLWVLRQAQCRIVETPIIYRSSVSHLSRGRVTEAAKLWWRLAWA